MFNDGTWESDSECSLDVKTCASSLILCRRNICDDKIERNRERTARVFQDLSEKLSTWDDGTADLVFIRASFELSKCDLRFHRSSDASGSYFGQSSKSISSAMTGGIVEDVHTRKLTCPFILREHWCQGLC